MSSTDPFTAVVTPPPPRTTHYPLVCACVFLKQNNYLEQVSASHLCQTVNNAASLHLPVRSQQRTLGILSLGRTDADPAFTGQDKKRLAQLLPYLVRALTQAPLQHVPWVDSGEEGLLVADSSGRIRTLTPQARQLLALAGVAGSGMATDAEPGLPERVIQLCSRLAQAEQEGAAVTDSWSLDNLLGRYVFRVQRLEATREFSCEALLCISIRRQIALPLKLLRGMDNLTLSFREMQFCLALASGYGQVSIAQRMNISTHTAITHRRSVYAKLGVHNRAGLMSKLLAL